MTPAPGETVGTYVLDDLLGRGGMGEVWKAWDPELRRWVALKFLKTDDPQDVARFRREAQTAAGLHHPNIASVYEVGEIDGTHFIAMQYVEGPTLAALSRDDRRRLVALVRDAARALHAAHERGVIHRDVKPDNLMFDARQGRLYVTDFGLAKARAVDSSLSMSGMVVGTPGYMSPEQARGKIREIDARSDVYSLGATLYELLTGGPPFAGADVFELLRRIVDEDPVPVRLIRPDVDRDLDAVVMKCLEKDPGRRYSSALALEKDLTRCLEGEAVRARRWSRSHRLSKFLARRRAVVIPTLAAAALGLLLVAWATAAAVGKARKVRRGLAEAAGLEAAGELGRARDEYRSARDLDPLNEVARSGFERTDAEVRRREAAIREKSEAKEKEDRIFGPIRERLEQLPASEAGWRRGIELLEDGLREYDRSYEAWMAKGRLHEKLFEWDEAFAAYGRALELNPRLGTAHYRRGMILIRRDPRGTRTLAEFEKALEVEPDNEYARIALALVAALRRDCPGAVKLCEEAEPTGQNTPEFYFVRAFIRSHEGCRFFDADRAIRDYGRAIELDPRSAGALHNRGLLRVGQRDLQGGGEDFTKAIEIDPRNVRCYVDRGNVRLAMGELAAAMADYDKAIELSPTCAHAYVGRGNVRLKRGDLDRAIDEYTKAIEVDPDCFEAYNDRGVVRREMGDPDRAISDLTKAIEIAPRLARAYLNRGKAYHLGKDTGLAIADYTKAIDLEPHLAEAFGCRAAARLDEGNLDRAVEDCTKAIELDCRSATAYAVRARARIAMARRDPARVREYLGDAAKDYEMALAVAPKEWPHRGRAEAELREIRRRLESLDRNP